MILHWSWTINQFFVLKSIIVPVITARHGMVARIEGKFLNLASIAGKLPGPWQAVYHWDKGICT